MFVKFGRDTCLVTQKVNFRGVVQKSGVVHPLSVLFTFVCTSESAVDICHINCHFA